MWEKITNFTKNEADQGERQEKETASMLDSAYIPCKGTLGAKIGWRTAGNEKGRGVFALERRLKLCLLFLLQPIIFLMTGVRLTDICSIGIQKKRGRNIVSRLATSCFTTIVLRAM